MMNNEMVVKAYAQKTGITVKDAKVQVEALVEVIQVGLLEHNKVRISDLGDFVVRDRAARTGRNPKTGEALEIAATKITAFKAAKALKDVVKP